MRNTDRQIERKCALWVERESKIGTASVCTCVCVGGCVWDKSNIWECACVCVCVRETHLGKRVVLPYSRSKDSIIQSMKCICVFHIVVVNVVHRKKDRKKESWLISSDSASCTCCACKEWGYGRKCGVERPSSFFHPLQYYLWSTTHCERDENGSQNDWEIPWC